MARPYGKILRPLPGENPVEVDRLVRLLEQEVIDSDGILLPNETGVLWGAPGPAGNRNREVHAQLTVDVALHGGRTLGFFFLGDRFRRLRWGGKILGRLHHHDGRIRRRRGAPQQ